MGRLRCEERGVGLDVLRWIFTLPVLLREPQIKLTAGRRHDMQRTRQGPSTPRADVLLTTASRDGTAWARFHGSFLTRDLHTEFGVLDRYVPGSHHSRVKDFALLLTSASPWVT
jgi:hypothetical protein